VPGHEVRAVEKREPFLRLEDERAHARTGQRLGGGNLPVAVISNLVSTLVTTNFSTFTITNPPILRDGLYDLLGQARDSDSTPSYQVVLRRPGETNDFANVTPVPVGCALN